MANYSIDIPGSADVQMAVDDTLTITFISAATFCVESGDPNAFDPALPVGQPQQPGTVWPSANQGAKALSDTTIKYSHCGNNEKCGSGHKRIENGPGTIKVGSGR